MTEARHYTSFTRDILGYEQFIEETDGLDGRLMINDSNQATWCLETLVLDDLVLQRWHEGGSNTYEGVSAPGRIGLYLKLPSPSSGRVYGRPWTENTLCLTRPDQAVAAGIEGELCFCGLTLPVDRFLQAMEAFDHRHTESVLSGPLSIDITPTSARRIGKLVNDVIATSEDRGRYTNPLSLRSTHEALVEAFLAGFVSRAPGSTRTGRPKISRRNVISAIRDYLNEPCFRPRSVADMARHSGLPRRTLRHVVQECFGLSPRRLILLVQIHEVHDDLVRASNEATVSGVSFRHGIWDQGRFAARYRDVFGENPSETLAHSCP